MPYLLYIADLVEKFEWTYIVGVSHPLIGIKYSVQCFASVYDGVFYV